MEKLIIDGVPELQEIWQKIKSRDNFLLTLHPSPDLDSICSNYVMLQILKRAGKKATLIGGDNFKPINFAFIADLTGEIRNISFDQIDFEFDNLLVLDITRPERVSSKLKDLKEIKHVISIDHHLGNTFVPSEKTDVFLNDQASSTCEVIIRLTMANQIALNNKELEALYVGIYSDTCGFSTQTSATTLLFASFIKNSAKNVDARIEKVEKQWTMDDLTGLQEVLFNYTVEAINNIPIGILVTDKNFDIDKLLQFLSKQKGIKILVVSTKDDYFRISIRSWMPTEKAIAKRIAEQLGGSGHANRAGGKELVLDDIVAIRQKIIKAISMALMV